MDIAQDVRRILRDTTRSERINLVKSLCYICGNPVNKRKVSWDHVIPRCKVGTGDVLNLLPTHERCNVTKSDKVSDSLKGRALFLQHKLIAFALSGE